MPDARVIPIGGGDRPSRRAADAVAAGASRAGGERARRRRSPLIDDTTAPATGQPATGQPAGDDAAPDAAEAAAASPTSPASPVGSSADVPTDAAPQRPAPRRRPRSARSAAAAEPAGASPARTTPAAEVPAAEPDGAEATPAAATGADLPEWERKLASVLAFARRRLTGDVQVDEFGFDPELTDKVLLALVRPLYERYFRVEARGLENVPVEGGALLVANHSGTIPLDSIMTQIALLDHHPGHRHLRLLGADLVFSTPIVSELARKTGTTLACNADAERLLNRGELVGVWPEGFKGIGKPFSERYKLQRFGRGGFVSAALRAGVPIVPCSIVGAEEIYPIIGNMKTLARLLGLPYVPVTPTFPWLGPLGAIPLPSKWIIEFGEPIQTDGYGLGSADDPMLVFNLTDQVRETIQHTLYRLLMARRSIFF
ncbi:MAG TPA: lysophospholipid acyltransferase family protein [Actinomycetes bacterium]|nr:lysophospholipid acyltransferase family protein [Actinomycetes bacterium]